MFQQIVDAISGSSWSYAIVFGVAASMRSSRSCRAKRP